MEDIGSTSCVFFRETSDRDDDSLSLKTNSTLRAGGPAGRRLPGAAGSPGREVSLSLVPFLALAGPGALGP